MRLTFILLSINGFFSGAHLRLFDVILPILSFEYEISVEKASIVITSFGISYGLFQLIHGFLSDKYGLINVIKYSTFFLSLFTLLTFFSKNIYDLSMLRFLSGIFAGSVIPLTLAWIGNNSKYSDRQKRLGQFLGFVLAGSILGPICGGLLSEHVGWKHNFLFLSFIFFFLSFLINFFSKKEEKRDLATKTTVIFKKYYLILSKSWPRLVMLVVFFEGAFFYGSFSFTGAYLKNIFLFDYTKIGFFLSAFGIGGVIFSLIISYLVNKFSKSSFVLIGGLLLFICFIFISLFKDSRLIFSCLLISGIGFYFFHNTLQTFSSEIAPQSRALAFSLHAFCFFIGCAVGVYLNSFILKFFNFEVMYFLSACLLLLLSIFFRSNIIINKKN